MDNVEEENEDDMMAMMASLERRQTTDPRALALAAMGRKSMKENRHAAMAATVRTASLPRRLPLQCPGSPCFAPRP